MLINLRTIGGLLLVGLCCAQNQPPKGPAYCTQAPETKVKRDLLPNQFIVKMTDAMPQAAYDRTINLVRTALGAGDELRHTFFFSDFRAFSVEASPTVMNVIRTLPGVEEVTENELLHNEMQQAKRFDQPDTVYGLDRISHHSNGFYANRSYNFPYVSPIGAGTTIYVVDSGVYIHHNDFQGRARKGRNFAPTPADGVPPAFIDDGGHGTHVASIAAGYTYGVAKRADVVDVKIFNNQNDTTTEAEVAGISWAANDAEDHGRTAESVINYSVGGPAHQSTMVVRYAVRSAVRAGVFITVAAGNRAEPVADFSPANEPLACTVGGTAYDDTMYSCSNFGPGIDIWAPGADIVAAGIAGPSSTSTKYGTSMAAPYVAGVAAYLKSFKTYFYGMTPTEACTNLASFSSRGYIKFPDYASPSGPNVLLFDGAQATNEQLN